MYQAKKVWFDFDQAAMRVDGAEVVESAPGDSHLTAPPVTAASSRSEAVVGGLTDRPQQSARVGNAEMSRGDEDVGARELQNHGSGSSSGGGGGGPDGLEEGESLGREQDNGSPVPRLWDASDRPPLNPYLNPESQDDPLEVGLSTGGMGDPAGDQGLAHGESSRLAPALSQMVIGETQDHPVMVEAYMRHVRELENEALGAENMEEERMRRLRVAEENHKQKRGAYRQQLKDLQEYQKSQISQKDERERIARANQELPLPGGPYQSLLTREGGVAASLGSLSATSITLPSEVVQGARSPPPTEKLSPRTLMVQRMQKRMAGSGAMKAQATKIDRTQLLESLRQQIDDQEHRKTSERKAELDEERRFLQHVHSELRLHTKYTRAAELAKQRDLLLAWERDGHIRNLQKLRSRGTGAMRDYTQRVLVRTGQQSLGGGSIGTQSLGAIGFDPRAHK